MLYISTISLCEGSCLISRCSVDTLSHCVKVSMIAHQLCNTAMLPALQVSILCVQFHCPVHSTGACLQVVQSLRDKPKAWYLGWAGALISQEREYKALHEVKNMKVRCFHTSRQHETAQFWKPVEHKSVDCQPSVTYTHTTYDLLYARKA